MDAHDNRNRTLRKESTVTANETLRGQAGSRHRSYDEVRRSEAELAEFFDTAPIPLHWVAPDGRILRANRAEMDLLGYSRDEYLGHHIGEYYVDREVARDVLRRVAHGERLKSYDAMLRAKDGSIKHVQLDSNGLWRNGKLIHVGCFTHDITDYKRAGLESAEVLAREKSARKRAEAAADLVSRLQVVIDISLMHLSLDELLSEMLARIVELLAADAAVVGLLIADPRGVTVCTTFGIEESIASELCEPNGLTNTVAASRAPLVIDELSSFDQTSRTLRDEARSLVAAPLMIEGEVIGVIHVLTKQSHRFSDDDVRLLQLVADRVALAIEHTRLYEAEQRARIDAEVAGRMKDEFLATVSHELRSPLNAILGWVQLLREGKLSADSASRALETIERSARTQNRIISDLLDVSKIIASKLELTLEPCQPARIIEDVVEAARPAAQSKLIDIRTSSARDIEPMICDPDRIYQIVWNLVSNAIKFTPIGGEVRVRLEREHGGIIMVVSDTGMGISPEFLPHVFDRFRQADSSSTRRQGGLGLGLAIARHLAELHNGSIEVDSGGYGKGATFTVKLPLTSVRASTRQAMTKRQRNAGAFRLPRLTDLRVLIVDDDPDSLELESTVLRRSGADVRNAASKDEAVAVLSDNGDWRPEVLVSDIEMADGYQLIGKVREVEAERGGQLLAVALSGRGRVKDRMHALAAGFQMHISKPIEPEELVTALASLTGRLGKNTECGLS